MKPQDEIDNDNERRTRSDKRFSRICFGLLGLTIALILFGMVAVIVPFEVMRGEDCGGNFNCNWVKSII